MFLIKWLFGWWNPDFFMPGLSSATGTSSTGGETGAEIDPDG